MSDIKIKKFRHDAWTSWEPNGTPAPTTEATWTGLIKRLGDSALIQVNAVLLGAPAAGNFILSLSRLGITIDTKKILDITTPGAVLPCSKSMCRDASTGKCYAGEVIYNSTTSVIARIPVVSGAAIIFNGGLVTDVYPFTWAIDDSFNMQFMVPVTEWTDYHNE